jgi:hypothetical protein
LTAIVASPISTASQAFDADKIPALISFVVLDLSLAEQMGA